MISEIGKSHKEQKLIRRYNIPPRIEFPEVAKKLQDDDRLQGRQDVSISELAPVISSLTGLPIGEVKRLHYDINRNNIITLEFSLRDGKNRLVYTPEQQLALSALAYDIASNTPEGAFAVNVNPTTENIERARELLGENTARKLLQDPNKNGNVDEEAQNKKSNNTPERSKKIRMITENPAIPERVKERIPLINIEEFNEIVAKCGANEIRRIIDNIPSSFDMESISSIKVHPSISKSVRYCAIAARAQQFDQILFVDQPSYTFGEFISDAERCLNDLERREGLTLGRLLEAAVARSIDLYHADPRYSNNDSSESG